MGCQECRNTFLLRIVDIRRSSRKILDAKDGIEPGLVVAAVLNINHALNSMEAHIERCRNAEIRADKREALGNL